MYNLKNTQDSNIRFKFAFANTLMKESFMER